MENIPAENQGLEPQIRLITVLPVFKTGPSSSRTLSLYQFYSKCIRLYTFYSKNNRFTVMIGIPNIISIFGYNVGNYQHCVPQAGFEPTRLSGGF